MWARRGLRERAAPAWPPRPPRPRCCGHAHAWILGSSRGLLAVSRSEDASTARHLATAKPHAALTHNGRRHNAQISDRKDRSEIVARQRRPRAFRAIAN